MKIVQIAAASSGASEVVVYALDDRGIVWRLTGNARFAGQGMGNSWTPIPDLPEDK